MHNWGLVFVCVWAIWITYLVWELWKDSKETNSIIVSMLDDMREIQGLPTIRTFGREKE